MDNARRSGLGLVFAIIGFFIGRTYLPATPDKVLTLSSFTTKTAPAVTQTPMSPVAPAATPGLFAPVANPNAFPTPYPTPATVNDNPAVRAVPAPAPAQIPSQAPIRVQPPASSNPSAYPTPYPTPAQQPTRPTTTPGTMVNRVQASGPAPAAFSLDSFDRQSHLIYLILVLLGIGIIYKKRSNDAAVCVAMLIIGIVLGHYVDPGPINLSNPFNKTV